MRFVVQCNSVSGFHHQLSRAVSSVTGAHQVISVWRPNCGLIKQQLQSLSCPLSVPSSAKSPHLRLITCFESEFGVGILPEFSSKLPHFFFSVMHYLKRLSSFYMQKHNRTRIVHTYSNQTVNALKGETGSCALKWGLLVLFQCLGCSTKGVE